MAHIFDWMSSGWVHLWPFNSSANMRSLSCLVRNLKWAPQGHCTLCYLEERSSLCLLGGIALYQCYVRRPLSNPTQTVECDTCGWVHVTWNVNSENRNQNSWDFFKYCALLFQTISVPIETGVLPVCTVEIGLNHPFYSPLVEWQLQCSWCKYRLCKYFNI